MTEQTGSTQPPEWYTKPPQWLADLQQSPPGRRDRYRDDDDRDYRGRGGSSADVRELETAIRAMPEQVVSALREAIQGATQGREQNTGGQQQNAGQQGTGQQPEQKQEETPKERLTWGERFLTNQL
jgi:hypothetical protein